MENITNTIQQQRQDANRGEDGKILAMVILGVGSFLAGMLPAIISQENRRRFPFVTSLTLCFGAGILFATALVHILPEVRRQMNSNSAEVFFCGGFFIIYLIDEFIHYFFVDKIRHTHSNTSSATDHNRHHHSQQRRRLDRNYGSLATEVAPLLDGINKSSVDNRHAAACTSNLHTHNYTQAHCDEVAVANSRLCPTSHQEPCVQTITGTLGLFAALSLHAIIEGLVIGIQNTDTKVLLLCAAVGCHKFVMGFCLGLEFRSNPQTTLRSQFIVIILFSMGAVCGIGLGMMIVDIPATWNATILPIIQALAGGTLMYVTVCEVLTREKARWHRSTVRQAAGIMQFGAVFLGFFMLSVINFYLVGG